MVFIAFFINFAAQTKAMDNELYMSAIDPVRSELDLFREHFNSLLKDDDPDVASLLERLRSRSGKMMRPILVLLTGKYFGFPTNRLYNVAAGLELLHTATLIHDDVVDNSMMRRGLSSFNAVFDNKLSVLFGDYILAKALGEMSRSGLIDNIMALSALCSTLSLGEIAQLAVRNDEKLDEDSYFDIISRKTACLFSFAGSLSAATCGADDSKKKAFGHFGHLAGLCFQIRDDIFDYYQSDETGKPSGNDLKEGKFTLPAIYALNSSKIDWSDTIRDIRSCNASDKQIADVTAYSIQSGGIDYAVSKMSELSNEALTSLPSDMPSNLKKAFESYMSLIIRRNK